MFSESMDSLHHSNLISNLLHKGIGRVKFIKFAKMQGLQTIRHPVIKLRTSAEESSKFNYSSCGGRTNLAMGCSCEAK